MRRTAPVNLNPCAVLPLLPPTPPPTGPEISQRALDTLEFWAKFVGALATIALFVSRVLKPYNEWRKRQLAETILEVLKQELAVIDTVDGRTNEVFRLIGVLLARQEEMFRDVDAFLEIAANNTDRIDETNDLLDASGFSNERRTDDPAERERIAELFSGLHERRRDRRRHVDEIHRMSRPFRAEMADDADTGRRGDPPRNSDRSED